MARTVDHSHAHAAEQYAGTATLHPNLEAHICRTYKVGASEAPAWEVYDWRRATWWHRTGLLLTELLCSPERYVAEAVRCMKEKHGGVSPTPEWIAAWQLDAIAVRTEIMAAFPGRGPVWVSNQILGMHGNGKPDWLLLRSLIHDGFLPRKPMTPAEIAAQAQINASEQMEIP